MTITGQMRLGQNGGIYRLGTSSAGVFTVQGAGSTVTADGGGTLHIWDATGGTAAFNATNNNLVITSVITNDGASPVAVNVMGYIALNSANTFSGGVSLNQGRIQAGNASAYGTGPVTVYPGAQAFINTGTGNFANNFTVSGNGPTETNSGVNDGAGAIRLGTTAKISGTVTYSGATRLTTNSGGAGGSFLGRISGTGPLQVGGFGASPAIMNLTNTGAANDWNGPLTISSLSNSRVFHAATRRERADPEYHRRDGNTAVTPSDSTLELNGFSETIGALNSALNPGDIFVSNLTSSTTSTLTLGATNANGDYGGYLRDKIDAPASTLNLVKTGTGRQVLRGTVEIAGTTTVNGGILESIAPIYGGTGDLTVNTGGTFAANGSVLSSNVNLAGGTLRPTLVDAGQLTLEGNLNLATGSTLDLNMASFPSPSVAVIGTVNPSGGPASVNVNLSGVEPPVGQHPLLTYGTLGGTGSRPSRSAQAPPRMVANIIDNPGSHTVVLNVTASGISAVWTGALSSEWSTVVQGEPKNWVLSSNPLSTTDFLSNDAVIFNDSAANNTVDLSVADVVVSKVTFDNTTDTYLLTGSKAITGAGQLVKNGSGTAEIANPNTFTGGTTINTGTLQLNNGGSLGTGLVWTDGTFALNKSDSTTFANVIDGNGGFRHSGTGTTTLSGVNPYAGSSVISAGTVRVTNNSSLGGAAGPVQVLAGGAVDIAGNPANTQNFGAKQFLISGNGPSGTGALTHSGTVGQLNAYQQVALEADASVGGTGRFDIRGGGPVLDLNGHTLRKRGTNQFTLVWLRPLRDGGTVIVEQGLFAIETASVTEGNGSVICEPGTYAGFYQNVTGLDLENNVTGVSWPYTLREGVALGNAGAALATILSPIILEGNVQFTGFNASAPDPAQIRPLTLTGNITENGGTYGITKNGISVVTLTGAASTYTGATLVNAGTVIVNGAITASPVTVAVDATLGGTGTLGGTLAGNGTISPGMDLIGTLATGATTLGNTAALGIQINSTTLTSDALAVNGSLQLGGSLGLSDLAPAALAPETKIVIATYTGGISGAFANVADGGTLTVGPNTFVVNYDDSVSGQNAVTLTVPTGTPYDAWATLMGLTALNNGRLADPDNDGLENIVEFGLNGNPLGSAADGKTRAVIADVDAGAPVENAFTLTIPVRTGAVFGGPGDLVSGAVDSIVYSIQGSATLADFTTVNVAEVTPALSSGMPALSSGWTYRTFRLPGTAGSPNAKAYLRVGVTDAPLNPSPFAVRSPPAGPGPQWRNASTPAQLPDTRSAGPLQRKSFEKITASVKSELASGAKPDILSGVRDSCTAPQKGPPDTGTVPPSSVRGLFVLRVRVTRSGAAPVAGASRAQSVSVASRRGNRIPRGSTWKAR